MDKINYGRITKGIKNDLIIKGSEIEKSIVKQFSMYFGVTFSRQETFKNTDYVFAFLQPGNEYREKFNMYNEFLLLFSSFTDFDRRILDFADKIISEYDNRLDKVCIFLISKDMQITQKINALTAENKDSKLIVPFKYNELLNTKFTKDNLENKLRKYFYSRDLFAIASPIQNDSYFFGRNKVVQELHSKYISGEQAGLFGLRKIGKTSVLYALMRRIDSKEGRYLFTDCQSPSIHALRWFELIQHILLNLIDKYSIEINLDNFDFNEKSAAGIFEKVMLEIYSCLKEKRILLIFDEIEMITIDTSSSVHWREGMDFVYFWQTIRAFYQSHPQVICFLIAGVNPHCVEVASVNNIDNPIFSMIDPMYLNLFQYEDVKNMVSSIGKYMGLDFDEQIFTLLANDYGGHPFLIRHICSLINSNAPLERPHNVSKYSYLTEKRNYDISISKYIEQIIQVLKNSYPNEYLLLETLAVKGNDSFKSCITISDFSTIQHLMGYGILHKYQNDYNITIQALSIYLKNSSKLLEEDSQEAKRANIGNRRNRIESKLRDLIYVTIVGIFGKDEGRTKILSVKKSEDRGKYADISTKDILANEYYLREVKILIEKNWENFKHHLCDKSKFSSYIQIINDYRVDAHAKDITDDDYMMTNIALKWFESILFE